MKIQMKFTEISRCAKRIKNVEGELKAILSNLDGICSSLENAGIGEITPNISLIINQLQLNGKKIDILSTILCEIVKRYRDAEEIIERGNMRKTDKGITENSANNQTDIYVENYLLEQGFSQHDIEYIRRRYPGYLSSLYATLHWSSPDAEKIIATINAVIESHQGDYIFFPTPGSTIIVSPGTDKPSYECIVGASNVWSLEYSISGCQNAYGESLCWKRLEYAIEHYDYNAGEQDLLQFYFDGYEEPVYAGAMIEGYADVGDIVYVTLDNGEGFYFMILDTKSNHHISSQFPPGQVQYENGHGYLSDGTVLLSNCEFIMSDWIPGVNSAINTESGSFLADTNVISAEIIDHVNILE